MLNPSASVTPCIFGRAGVAVLFSLLNIASAAAEGWSDASSMARARHHHTATLLPTGEVLVVGGDTSPARSSAQLFDYRTGRWTTLDGLAIGRSRHTATLVDAAQVWVIGGTDHPDDRRPLASVERFDLETRSWSSAPELTTARWGHTTTRLPSGDLLVVGGSIQPNDFNFDALSSVERFDRSLGSWQPAAPLRRSRVFHTATLLRDGTVLVVGGQVDGLGFSTSAEVYDPITDVWRKVDDMARPRRGHTATLLPTGEVLVAGGSSNTPETGLVSVDSVEIYDPRNDQWSITGILNQARYLHTAALLPSGQVLVIGGSEFDLLAGVTTTPIASTEVYDPIRGIWTPVDSMSGGRAEGSSVVLPDGRVLVVGGERVEAGVEATPLSSAEIYDPVIPAWVERAELPGSRWDHTATPLLSGGVLVVGGRAPDPLATVARYEPGTDTWHTIASLESPRYGHTATRLDADRVLVVGGRGLDGSSLDTAEVYEPSRRAWLPATKLPVPFDLHTATRLASGDVLVTGGGQAALFDQTTETWITLPPPAVRRSRHTATLLRSGKVLVAGGGDGNDPSAELYDPESRSWSATGPMRLDRDRHTASLLPSDRVLVAGGFNGGPVGRAELYDPVTNTWAEAAPSQLAAFDRVAALMPSGRILLAGGGDRLPDGSTAAAEVYDPATERWHPLPALAETTREATATVLDSGAVLIVGGQQDDGNATNRVALLQTDGVERVDRPRIDDAPSVLRYGDPLEGPALTVRGTFSGNSDGGDGTSGHVAANVPMIRMARLGADDQVWLAPDQLVTIEPPWDDDVRDEPSTLTVSTLLPELHPGPHLLSVVVAGVASEPRWIDVECSLVITRQPEAKTVALGRATSFAVESHGGRTVRWESCHGDPATTCAPPDPTLPGERGGPGWTEIPGANGTIYVTDPIVAPMVGTLYRAVVGSGCTSEISAAGLLQVADSTPPGVGTGPPVAVVSPSGGELWPLSSPTTTNPNTEVISWTMSDDIRICAVDLDLVFSNDGGQHFDGRIDLASFGAGGACHHPGEQTTSFTYSLPETPPSGQSGSLYKIEVTVTDHAGNATTAESERPFYIVEPSNDSIETLILWHPDRMRDLGMKTDDLTVALGNLADHPAVRGRVVDLGLSEALGDLYSLWDVDEIDTAALLFGRQGLRDYLHDEWLARFPAVEHLILVGDDRQIPFARLPDGTAAAAVPVSEEAYPSDPAIDPDADLTADGTAVGEALAANHYLSDDPLATRGAIRPNDLDDTIFLPDLGVGRLVETPTEIIDSIAAFISSEGVVDLTRRSRPVFVSAYDFLIDGGTRIEERWQSVLDDGATEALIGQTWASSDLTAGLCGADAFGVVSLNGHATHHQLGHPSSAGPYVIEGTPTTDLAGCDLTGSLVYAVGCHSGLSVADDTTRPAHDHPRDMPQAMLDAGALAFLGNTGYGWGLHHGVGYSERLVELFTQELTAGGGIEIGEAVRRAKTRYFLESPYFDTFDEKVSMQWTLYGFPMLRLRTGAPESGAARPFDDPPPTSAAVPYRQQLGPVTVERRVVGKTVVDGVEVVPPAHLSREPRSFDFRGDRVYKVFDAAGREVGPLGASPDHCDRSKPDPDPNDGIPQGCYRTLNGLANGQDVHSGATDRPLQPLLISDVGLSGTRFHGFLWLGGTYVEQRDWVPLFGELQSNIDGGFSDRGALPSNSKGNGRGRIRHGGALGDLCAPSDLDRTSLVLEAGEVLRDGEGAFSIERHYETIDTEIFYYNNADDPAQNCDITGPRVIAEHTVSGSRVAWTVRADADEVDSVWRVAVVWTDNTVDAEGRGRWQPLELVSTDGIFEGSVDAFGSTRLTYFVQAVDERGNVSVVATGDPHAASGVVHELPELVEVDLAQGEADLAITLDATPDPVPGLTTLTTVVELTNRGPDAAGGVLVSIEPSDTLADVGVSGAGWSCADASPAWRCTRSALDDGAIASIRVFGTAPHEGSIELAATVHATSHDPMPGNDAASRSIPVVDAPRADLTIHQDATVDGDLLSLRIRVHNDGPSAADPSSVRVSLPPSVDELAWQCSAGAGASSCTSAGVGPLVDRVRLEPSGFLDYVVTARVGDARGMVESIATVTPPVGVYDPDPASNTATVVVDLASPILGDGFESETLDAWSAVVGSVAVRDEASIVPP